MFTIGAHVSIAKGFKKAAQISVDIGANTFQFFSRNPRGGNAKEFNEKDMEAFQKIREENNFGKLLAHAPYTMNLAAANEDTYEFAKMVIREDVKRMDSIGVEYICFHPGSHVGGGVEEGTRKIIEGLNQAITGDENITVLLETMSGKGTEIGRSFEEIRAIIDGVEHNERMGVCMDTCHIFSAGYDIVNDLDGVLDEFDRVIGLDRLKTIHLNDSMMPFGKNKDRHAGIGEGEIGMKALLEVVNHPKLRDIPFFLETPYDDEGHGREIAMLKENR
ncbi:deoxyribonuclease IV [Peptoclostridium sp. AF21-18]|uniref:deoxyribonuclease IV n=1 Tax=Peptoclostridium sp. AF21-18 TaxID=2292243 RepID=UPI000E4CE2EC|nr:deoxyribonuclease IV [Peptoclostridium sp. AF21-18]RHQ99003.1 deoxyribonuclease IV [Peptoclostridium sp. AF21-18]